MTKSAEVRVPFGDNSSDKATLLLAAVENLGLEPGVVRVDTNGARSFIVPREVADAALSGEDAESVSDYEDPWGADLSGETVEALSPEEERKVIEDNLVRPAADGLEEQKAEGAAAEKRAARKRTAANKTPAKKAAAKKTAAKRSAAKKS